MDQFSPTGNGFVEGSTNLWSTLFLGWSGWSRNLPFHMTTPISSTKFSGNFSPKLNQSMPLTYCTSAPISDLK